MCIQGIGMLEWGEAKNPTQNNHAKSDNTKRASYRLTVRVTGLIEPLRCFFVYSFPSWMTMMPDFLVWLMVFFVTRISGLWRVPLRCIFTWRVPLRCIFTFCFPCLPFFMLAEEGFASTENAKENVEIGLKSKLNRMTANFCIGSFSNKLGGIDGSCFIQKYELRCRW